VACVKPALLPVTAYAGATLTVSGQHFGGPISRGYFSADGSVYASHVQVLLGGVPCRATQHISDTELLCSGVEAGHGLHDVQVVITDPFWSQKKAAVNAQGNASMLSSSLINSGAYAQGLARPSFLAGGINFLSVGYRSLIPPPNPPAPSLFNGTNGTGPSEESQAIAESCRVLMRSLCRNESSLEEEVPGLRTHASVHIECVEGMRHVSNRVLGLVYAQLSPYHFFNNSQRLVNVSSFFAHLHRLGYIFNGSGFFDESGVAVRPHLISNLSLPTVLNCSAPQAPLPEVFNPGTPAVSTSHVRLRLDGPVRALAVLHGRIFVGGGFKKAVGPSHQVPLVVSHVFEFTNVACGGRGGGGISGEGDGRGERSRKGIGYKTPLLDTLGDGTDGPVYSMTAYHDLIIVGGSFGKVFPEEGSLLLSGGLAAWDPVARAWSLVGRTPLPDAVVSQVKAHRNALYVVGRFRQIGGVVVNHVAVHKGAPNAPGGWSSLSSGIHGGSVSSITFVGNEVIVGGDFAKAGETFVSNIARWDGNQWQRMADEECSHQCALAKGDDKFVCRERNCELDGIVTALASSGAAVYAAGLFDRAGGRHAPGLAQYYGCVLRVSVRVYLRTRQ
jgi:hypothetical protein